MEIYLEKLLSPISDERPEGDHLRYQETYDRIQEARREEEKGLPRGVWERELKKANWAEVRDLCFEALEKHSKDLQIAVWLLEALLHLEGFSGVRMGLEFLNVFCERFWEDMYPKLDEEMESRIAPMVWMNEKLSMQLKFIPITHPETDDAYSYNWADWEDALRLENLSKRDRQAYQRAEAEGKVTRAKFLGSVMFTPKAYYQGFSQELEACLELSGELEKFFDEKCGKIAPNLSTFRSTLGDIRRLVDEFMVEKVDDVMEEGGEEAGIADVNMTAEARKSYVGSIRSRAEAYRMLSAAADYLLMTEPHSPTPYLVRRAVSWGNMTLTQLLQELVGDERDLQHIFSLLGIRALGG